MTDTPTPGPVVSPTPDQNISPPSPDQINAFVAFLQKMLTMGALRQEFNPTTFQFWATLSSLAAIVMAWINVNNTVDHTVQSVITAIGGVVLAVVAAQSHKPTVNSLLRMIRNVHDLPLDHKQIIAKSFTPVVLNPSPAGAVTVPGYYPEGTHTGSVLAPGAIIVVAGPGGTPGVTGTGGTTPGATNEGNVSPHVTVNVQSGGYTPGTGAESNLPLGTNVGTNSAEGTGGPVIANRQGGLGTGGSVEAPGAYVQPASPAANPDEANPNIFHAKAEEPHKRARREPK